LKKYISLNRNLTDLNLKNTGLAPEQLNEIIDIVRVNNKDLRWLNISENPMTHKPIEKY